MIKLCFLSSLFITTVCYGQAEQKFSVFATLGVNKTLYDYNALVRKTGIAGSGLQAFLNTKSGIKATLELNADLFTVPQIGPADEPLKPKKIIIPSLYLGYSLPLTNRFYVAIRMGTNVYYKQAHFGIRPAVEYYPSKVKNWAVKTSFTNVFQKDAYLSYRDFGYISFGSLFKL